MTAWLKPWFGPAPGTAASAAALGRFADIAYQDEPTCTARALDEANALGYSDQPLTVTADPATETALYSFTALGGGTMVTTRQPVLVAAPPRSVTHTQTEYVPTGSVYVAL